MTIRQEPTQLHHVLIYDPRVVDVFESFKHSR